MHVADAPAASSGASRTHAHLCSRTGDCHNLAACVRVLGLYGFGKLYAIGMRLGVPQLPYLACAAAQLLAAAGTLALSSAVWRGAASSEGQRARALHLQGDGGAVGETA